MAEYIDPTVYVLSIDILSDRLFLKDLRDIACEVSFQYADNLDAYSKRETTPEKYQERVKKLLKYDTFMEHLSGLKNLTGPNVHKSADTYYFFSWNVLEEIRYQKSAPKNAAPEIWELEKLWHDNIGSLFDSMDTFKDTPAFGRIVELIGRLSNCLKPDISDTLWPCGVSYTERGACAEYTMKHYSRGRFALTDRKTDFSSFLCPEAVKVLSENENAYLHKLNIYIPSMCISDESALESGWLDMLKHCLSAHEVCTGYIDKDISASVYPHFHDAGDSDHDASTFDLFRPFPKQIRRSAWAVGAAKSQIGGLSDSANNIDKGPFHDVFQYTNGNALLRKTEHAAHAAKEQMDKIARYIYPYTRKSWFSYLRLRDIPSLRTDLSLGKVNIINYGENGKNWYNLAFEDILL